MTITVINKGTQITVPIDDRTLTWWALKRRLARQLYARNDVPPGTYDGRLSKACGMRLTRLGRDLADSAPVTPGEVTLLEDGGRWPMGKEPMAL